MPVFNIIHHHYHKFGGDLGERLGRIEAMLAIMENAMALVEDMKAKIDQAIMDAERNSNAQSAIIDLLRANADQIRQLKGALDAAGTDTQKLQDLSIAVDKLAKMTDDNADRAAAAAVAGTTAEEKPEETKPDTPVPTTADNPPRESETTPGT